MKNTFIFCFLLLFTVSVYGAPFETMSPVRRQSRLLDKLVKGEKITVQIIDKEHPENTDRGYGEWIQTAFTKWPENVLVRLNSNASQREVLQPYMDILHFAADPTSYEPIFDTNSKADVKIFFVTPEYIQRKCPGAAGCAYPGSYTLYLAYPADLTKHTRTEIHEIGHLYNFEDLYNGMRNGKKYRNVFGDSIMNTADTLGCDDADGFVYMLHAAMHGEEHNFKISSFCSANLTYENGYLQNTQIKAVMQDNLMASKIYANCPGGPTQLLATVNWGNFDRLLTIGRNLPGCLRKLLPNSQAVYTKLDAEELPSSYIGTPTPQMQIWHRGLIPHAIDLYVHAGDGIPFYAYVLNSTESKPFVQFLFAQLADGSQWIYITERDKDQTYVFVNTATGTVKKELVEKYYKFFNERFDLEPYDTDWPDLLDEFSKEASQYGKWEHLAGVLQIPIRQSRAFQQEISQQIKGALGK